jgi:glyoxylase-like metal-dependent hydrolase (beta-lactamase superfamily II)
MTTIGRKKVLFSGDSFQPASRWNGSGGFSSFNGSRFQEGFVRSANQIMEWKPDLLAAGHGTYFSYNEGYFRAVLRWAEAAEGAVKDLCSSGDLEIDYYLHPA